MKPDNFISKHKITLVSVGILVVLLATLIVVMCLRPGGDDPTDPTGPEPPGITEGTGQSTDPVETEPGAETHPTDSTSGTDVTNPAEPDPTLKPTEPDAAAKPTAPDSTTKPPNSTSNPTGQKLTCDRIARFTGKFVEDGSDIPVENVLAVLITNQTDEYLDLANLEFDVDGEKATFIVTGLPAGRSAWVMEATGMTVSEDAVCEYQGSATSFRDDVIASAEEVEIHTGDNLLQAENKTSRTLEDVFVYYKIVHSDGNYFGGITYMVTFGTLRPGETVEKIAGHYLEGETEIVRIGWQERQTDEAS